MVQFVPTILCGGVGSRLWPISRQHHPKPFIRLSDGQSLLQKAMLRGAKLDGAIEVLTVSNRELLFKLEDEYREVNHAQIDTSFILEPFGKNTAAAIACAALHIANVHGPDTVLLILPADHLISNQAAFKQATRQAIHLANDNRLVTFGIKPDSPQTAYGYIEASKNNVLRFIEKPSREQAQAYFESGKFLWNSGMFCFKASTMITALREHCPDILSATQRCIEQSPLVKGRSFSQLALDAASFDLIRDESIDFAVMEKASNVAVVPCDIGWSDIGSWDAFSELLDGDENGNRIDGHAITHHSANCYIKSDSRIVGAVGLNDLIIVDTPDALLVADKNRSQDVKHIFSTLKLQNHDVHKNHTTVHRPWGTYTILQESDNFKIKRIEVKPGASLSLQMHHHRSEHWIVVSGMARVVNGSEEIFIRVNESTYIPAGHQHRLENPGLLNLVMIEVQSGQYLGEDDIVRFSDVYGRA